MGVSEHYRQHRLKIFCMKWLGNALWQEDWNQTSLTLLVTSLHSHQYALGVELNRSLFAGSGKLYGHHHLMPFLSNLTIKGIGKTPKRLTTSSTGHYCNKGRISRSIGTNSVQWILINIYSKWTGLPQIQSMKNTLAYELHVFDWFGAS